jgi:ATP-dependent exoDNAse (exonuclease V) beta subunit
LVDNTQAVSDFGASAQIVFNRHRQEELLDNINVLYVALTRAEEQLYIISRQMKANKGGDYPNNMASYFIKYLEQLDLFDQNKHRYEFGQPQRQSNASNQPETLRKIELVQNRLKSTAIKIARRESIMWGTRQKEAIAYGNVVHEVMSFIKSKNEVDAAIQISLSKGILKLHEAETVRETIVKIVNHPELTDYFNEQNKVFNEQVILAPEVDIVKPDRIVINADGAYLLLDYKTGKQDKKHVKQLENYQSVIESMKVKVVKKALIYTGEHLEIIHL